MPAESKVSPVCVLLPERITLPVPVLFTVMPPAVPPVVAPVTLMSPALSACKVRRLVLLVIAPPIVRVFAELFAHVCAPPSVMPRFALPTEVGKAPAFTAMPLVPMVSSCALPAERL